MSKCNGSVVKNFSNSFSADISVDIGKLNSRLDNSISMASEILDYIVDVDFKDSKTVYPRIKKISRIAPPPKIPIVKMRKRVGGRDIYNFLDHYFNWVLPFIRSRRCKFVPILQRDYSAKFSAFDLKSFFNLLPTDIELNSFGRGSIRVKFMFDTERLSEYLVDENIAIASNNKRKIMADWIRLFYSSFGFPFMDPQYINKVRFNRISTKSLPYKHSKLHKIKNFHNKEKLTVDFS